MNIPREHCLGGISGVRNIIADRVSCMARRREASMNEISRAEGRVQSKVEHT